MYFASSTMESRLGKRKYRLMEQMDDGSLSSWFKENYFEKSTKKAMTDHFNLNDTDIEKFTPKKRKKRTSKQKSAKNKKENNTLECMLQDEQSEDSTDK